MLMTHSTLPGRFVPTTREAFDGNHRHHGWEEFTDVPIVDGLPAVDALVEGGIPDVASLSVPAVVEEVGDDPTKAAVALAAEKTGKNRTTLKDKLEPIVAEAPHQDEEK